MHGVFMKRTGSGFSTQPHTQKRMTFLSAKTTAERFWWLRTPGQTRLYATGIKSFGTPDYNGVNVQFPQGAIRPAIYLAMDSNQE